MSKVKENDIKMSFAMKYPKYFKIQLIVHRISAMFHLFFAPIDFPHHRLISRKTHPASWLFTSFHPNVARWIPSFKQIIHFSTLCTTPTPPLTTPSGKINMSKKSSLFIAPKRRSPNFLCFLALGSFFTFPLSFFSALIRFIEMQLLAVFCNVPWNQPPQHRQEKFHQIVVKRKVSNIQNNSKGCWLSHISVICYGKAALYIAFVLSFEYWNL